LHKHVAAHGLTPEKAKTSMAVTKDKTKAAFLRFASEDLTSEQVSSYFSADQITARKHDAGIIRNPAAASQWQVFANEKVVLVDETTKIQKTVYARPQILRMFTDAKAWRASREAAKNELVRAAREKSRLGQNEEVNG
jgi:hypothetical protein